MNTERFYKLGLDNYFEIIELGTGKGKEYHHKFKTKCKKCGFEQWRYDEILRKETSVLRCKNCGNSNFVSKAKPYIKKGYGNRKKLKAECETANGLNDKNKQRIEPDFVSAIVEMYQSGKEQKEIVETTGQTYCVVRYWLKKKGIFNPERRQHGNGNGFNEYNKVKEQEAESRLAFLLLEKGFFYLGKAEKTRFVRMSCLTCGGTFERYNDRHFRESAIECPICTAKAKEQKKRERQTVRDNRTIKELEKVFIKELDRMIIQNEPHYCKECGKKFTFKEYAEEYGFDPLFANGIEYCSKKCKRKALNKDHDKGEHIKRARKHGCEWERGITLKRLIKRDGLKCALCGGMCDLNDKSYGNGSGPNYPSIDHIKPISKGGSHTWENIQVAHIECNWRKSNKTFLGLGYSG